MAHRKAGGSTQLGRDSISKRLGVKIFGNQAIKKGQIIIRQRGTKYHPGKNVKRGGDDTLFAMKDGYVNFKPKKTLSFTGKLTKRTFVSVQEKISFKKSAKKTTKKKPITKKSVVKK